MWMGNWLANSELVEVCRTLCPGQTLEPSLWLELLMETLVVPLGALASATW